MKRAAFKHLWPFGMLVMMSLIVWGSGIGHYVSFESLKEHHHDLKETLIHHPFLAPLIYCMTYIVLVAFSIPGAAIMTITGGFLFGLYWGTFYTIFSATIGATIIFKTASYAVQGNRTGKIAVWREKLEKGFQENAFNYLLTLRLFPIVPFFIVNLVPGLLEVPLKTFVSATFVGIIPGSVVYTSLGVGLESVLQKQPGITISDLITPEIKWSLVGLAVLSIMPLIYKFWVKYKRLSD